MLTESNFEVIAAFDRLEPEYALVAVNYTGEPCSLIIASDGKSFFRCWLNENYRFCRKTSDKLEVQSQDLDYVAIGATMYTSFESAIAGLKITTTLN